MRWKFKATMLANDPRTGIKKGAKFTPNGFYYSGKNTVLVGGIIEGDNCTRASFPTEIVKVEVTKA